MNKDSQYVFIPTDKASEIFMDDNGKVFRSINMDQEQKHFKPQYIYVLSDDQIKEVGEYGVVQRGDGEWILGKVTMLGNMVMFEMENSRTPLKDIKTRKIIATTNPELHTKPIHREGKPDYIHEGTLSISQSDIEYIISLYNSKSKSVDVEDLALGYVGTKPEVMDEREIGKLHGFIDGYNQCLQDNADKKFTLQDIDEIINLSRRTEGVEDGIFTFKFDKDEIIELTKHLSITKEQPKSNTVMVEYEMCHIESYAGGNTIEGSEKHKPKLKDGNIVIVR